MVLYRYEMIGAGQWWGRLGFNMTPGRNARLFPMSVGLLGSKIWGAYLSSDIKRVRSWFNAFYNAEYQSLRFFGGE